MKASRLKQYIHDYFPAGRPLLFGASIIFLTGCAGDMQDLEVYVEQTKNKYSGSVEPLPQFEGYQSHAYSVSDRRDPFLSKVDENLPAANDGIGPDQDRRKEPLEYFPLDSLKMVGTLSDSSEFWGLIRDPDGKVHPVKPGQHAGENYGEILSITEDKITLLEIIQDGLGGWIERESSLITGEE